MDTKLDQGSGIIAIWRIDFSLPNTNVGANVGANAKSFHVCLLGFRRTDKGVTPRRFHAQYLSLNGSTTAGQYCSINDSKTITVIVDRSDLSNGSSSKLRTGDKWIKLQLDADSQLRFATLSCIDASHPDAIDQVKVVPVGNSIKLDILNSANNSADNSAGTSISPWHQTPTFAVDRTVPISNVEVKEMKELDEVKVIVDRTVPTSEVKELDEVKVVVDRTIPISSDVTLPIIADDDNVELAKAAKLTKRERAKVFFIYFFFIVVYLFLLTTTIDTVQNGFSLRTIFFILVQPALVFCGFLFDAGNRIYNRFLRNSCPTLTGCSSYLPFHDHSSASGVENLYRVNTWRENFLSSWLTKFTALIFVAVATSAINLRLTPLTISPPHFGLDNSNSNFGLDLGDDYSIFQLDEKTLVANVFDYRVLPSTFVLGFTIPPLILVRLNFTQVATPNFNAWLAITSSEYDSVTSVATKNGDANFLPETFGVMRFNQLRLHDLQEIGEIEWTVRKMNEKDGVENIVLELVQLDGRYGFYCWKLVINVTWYTVVVVSFIFLLLYFIFSNRYDRIWAIEHKLSEEFHTRAEQLARTTSSE